MDDHYCYAGGVVDASASRLTEVPWFESRGGNKITPNYVFCFWRFSVEGGVTVCLSKHNMFPLGIGELLRGSAEPTAP